MATSSGQPILFSCPSRIFGMDNGDSDLSFVMNKQTAQSALNDICAKKNCPMTILQWNAARKAERLDSHLATICLRPSCENFRRAAGSSYCEHCDNLYAEIFQGLSAGELLRVSRERLEKIRQRDDLYSGKITVPEIHEEGGIFLEYDCPMMGYREIISPIVFEEYVIGVLIVGQIRLFSDEGGEAESSRPEQIRRTFFEKNPTVFDQFIEKAKEAGVSYRPSKIIETIEARQNKDMGLFKNYLELDDSLISPEGFDILTPSKYSLLHKEISSIMRSFLKTLKEQMTVKREAYIRRAVDRATADFFTQRKSDKAMLDDTIPPTAVLKYFWSALERSLNLLIEPIGLKFIAIFGNDDLVLAESSDLRFMRYIPAEHSSGMQNASDTQATFQSSTYSIRDIDEDSMVLPSTSDDKPELFTRFSGHKPTFDTKNKLLIFFPVMDKPHFSAVMVFAFNSELNCYHDDIIARLKTSLINCGILMFSRLVSRMSRLSETATSRMLSIYRHEISHATMRLRNIYDMNLQGEDDEEFIKKLSVARINDIGKDYALAIRQLTNLSNNVERILRGTKSVNIKDRDATWIFKELLFQYKDLFHRQIEGKCLRIVFPDIYEKDALRPQIPTDTDILDQIAYNLIDNAVKYSYWGTKIYVDFAKPQKEGMGYSLIVTSYGPFIENNRDPYKLFHHGFKVDSTASEGVGIGLYVCERAARLLDAKVEHRCLKISDNHVPFLSLYHALFKTERPEYAQELFDELHRLKNRKFPLTELVSIECYREPKSVYTDIVCESALPADGKSLPDGITEKQVRMLIDKPTYKTTFEVSL